MASKKSPAGRIKSGLVLILLLLVACAGVQRTLGPENRIELLPDGPHVGFWETNDVFIEYQYVKQPGSFKINLGGYAKRAYDQVSVWVHFLDAQGNILVSKTLVNSGFRQPLTRPKDSIQKTFEIPMDTSYFAFQAALRDRIGQ